KEGVQGCERIHSVKHRTPQEACVFCDDRVVIVGIGIGNAAAAWRYTVEPALEERLKEYEEGAWPSHLLRINQLLAATELARGDVILHVGDHHWDNGPRLGDTCDLGNHPFLHDLRFDLPEAGLEHSLTSAFGDQDPGRTHQWIDDIAHSEGKLLHLPIHARANNRLIQIDLRLAQRRFGAGFFRREKRRNPFVSALLRSGCGSDCAELALCTDLEPLDLAEGNVSWI